MRIFQQSFKSNLLFPISRSIGKGRFFVALLLLLGACAGQTEQFYANLPARFRVQFVQTIPPLNAALNSMGEFATITQRTNVYIYSNTKTSIQRPVTDADRNYMGLSGFIVGLPNIPPIGSSVSQVVCYDLACPNCYEEQVVTREMQLQAGGKCYCRLCQRTYDLNNQGYVAGGTPGRSLYRYRVVYQSNTLLINN